MLTRQPYHKGFKPREAGLSARRTRMRRNFKKRLGTAKPREGSRRDLEKKLECLLARHVKVRDGFRCRQYGDPKIQCRGPLDAGHVYPKGRFPGGKFLASNIQAQCRAHNTAHVSRPEIMFTHYEESNGPGSLERLHAEVLAAPRKQPVEWLQSEIERIEAATKELELLEVA